jgi:hypothetical protein
MGAARELLGGLSLYKGKGVLVKDERKRDSEVEDSEALGADRVR